MGGGRGVPDDADPSTSAAGALAGARRDVDDAFGSASVVRRASGEAGGCERRDSFADKKYVHLHFRVAYSTEWGENLVLVGKGSHFGEWRHESGLWMACERETVEGLGDELVWKCRVSVPILDAKGPISLGPYRYIVVDEKVNYLHGEPSWVERFLRIDAGVENGATIVVHDTWRDPSSQANLFRSALFTKVLSSPPTPQGVSGAGRSGDADSGGVLLASEGETMRVQFKVVNLQPMHGARLCVVGAIPQLGSWGDGIPMVCSQQGGKGGRRDGGGKSDGEGEGPPTWHASIAIDPKQIPFEYKYAISRDDPQGKGVSTGEEGQGKGKGKGKGEGEGEGEEIGRAHV